MKNHHVKNRRHDEGCCSTNLSKNFFHVYNFIFFLAGCGVIAVGLWTILTKHEYIPLLTNLTYPLAAYVLVIAGCLTLIGVFIGCCSVQKENRCFIILYTFLLLLIFLIEVMVGMLSYVYRDQVEVELKHNLNATFVENYGVSLKITLAIDKMQQEYKCCGATSFENWQYSRWKLEGNVTNDVPDSCCKSMSFGCGASSHPSNIPYSGCIHKFSEVLMQQLVIICAVGLGLSVIPIFGMLLSCFLYFKLKDSDE
ncbi:CD151 antigen-like [Cimex lectularius]|uniref:Tetraspanin n=1 Tax=Cimex lectularius TaxID=79782 RepID=A0A8I6RDN6_CIMLE|nr:CD151 antigen-like [Cimex lectularius]